MCDDASALELVLKGTGAAVARASLLAICSTCISLSEWQAASCRATPRLLQLLQQQAQS
jgi:ribosomal protein L40E